MENTELGTTLESGTITNPRHSKLLDVHRYSEHFAVSHLVGPIWSKCFGQPENAAPRKGGLKPKADGLIQLRTLLLDLYMAWAEDPELSTAVAMNNTAWKTGSRYNKIGMSRRTPRLIDCLHERGFIDLAAASYAGPGAATNRTTRIRAAEPLRVLFRDAKFGPQHILTHPQKENIILRGAEKSQRNLEYTDTPETERMRESLRNYNWLLQRTFIDVPDQVEPFIERPIKSGHRAGEITRVPVCGFNNFVHRIFNRNDWRCGGRFYGGWWQGVGAEFRKRIHINDQPTVEIDYQALHVAILAAQHGVVLDGDPYVLEGGLVEGLDTTSQRKLVKLLVLMSLNAQTKNAACSAFRDSAPAGSQAKSMKNTELFRVMDAFVEKHPFLAGDLCADRGIGLMNTDSWIAAHILRIFTRLQIPVLSVHDSFIIDYSMARRLKSGMGAAAINALGCQVALSNNYLGLDEVQRASPDLVDDYVRLRHRPRCPAYEVRQRIFKERLAYLGSGGGGT
jgi:hypothetical protein